MSSHIRSRRSQLVWLAHACVPAPLLPNPKAAPENLLPTTCKSCEYVYVFPVAAVLVASCVIDLAVTVLYLCLYTGWWRVQQRLVESEKKRNSMHRARQKDKTRLAQLESEVCSFCTACATHLLACRVFPRAGCMYVCSSLVPLPTSLQPRADLQVASLRKEYDRMLNVSKTRQLQLDRRCQALEMERAHELRAWQVEREQLVLALRDKGQVFPAVDGIDLHMQMQMQMHLMHNVHHHGGDGSGMLVDQHHHHGDARRDAGTTALDDGGVADVGVVTMLDGTGNSGGTDGGGGGGGGIGGGGGGGGGGIGGGGGGGGGTLGGFMDGAGSGVPQSLGGRGMMAPQAGGRAGSVVGAQSVHSAMDGASPGMDRDGGGVGGRVKQGNSLTGAHTVIGPFVAAADAPLSSAMSVDAAEPGLPPLGLSGSRRRRFAVAEARRRKWHTVSRSTQTRR